MALLLNDKGHDKNTFPPSKGIHAAGGVPGMAEHDFNAAVGDEAERLLRGKLSTYGAQPSRASGVSLGARIAKYNAQYYKDKEAIGMSHHGNAGGSTVRGFGVFYWHSSAKGKKLAQMTLAAYKKEFPGYPIWGSGIFPCVPGTWTDFYLVRESAAPFILIEWEFFTNHAARKLMLTDDYRKRCGKVAASVACDWYGIKFDNVVHAAKPSEVIGRNYFLNGDNSPKVKEIQADLVKIGYKLDVDGIFGDGTEKVVKAFQKGNSLTVDGIWGSGSQAKLNAILANMNKAKDKIPDKKPISTPATKPEEEEIMDLTQWQKEEMRDIYKKAREEGVFTDDKHEKNIMNGTMTTSYAVYLMTVISGAALNNGKRIK